ncbi:hypothetical protein KFK14_22315 [Sphingobium phenoxybenzoativorans]|uniref:PEP-CTERM protein-sorting domain-containing protein n=1 Tax=Sphingobium phenoxybenzoativorans TaxID=1592790 RepID=A0A975Q1Q0_9SPHN|nr:hypothetical protein [Sphingobium phenoxybenzoativorans]QUT05652.1 hypothetical protein KFK14_22315 [Sphingobium phenoxybenzoativorans]
MIKTLALGISVLALSVSAPAFAATYDLGLLTNGTPTAKAAATAPGAVNDIIKFELGGTTDLGTYLNQFNGSLFGKSYNITGLSATFYSGGGTLIGAVGDTVSATFANLAAGNYYATVTGNAVGTGGGSYTLTLLGSGSAAPVPGPAGVLVVGAGLAALLGRRRRKKAVEAA